MNSKNSECKPLNIAVLTVSDRRTEADDTSGDYLQKVAQLAGHQVVTRKIVKEDLYHIRAQVSVWIASESINVILISGGTGLTPCDNTPEALLPLFDREIAGFGELFRRVSFEEIGSATIQSRALAGIANRTVIFAVPGSASACRTAWEAIIQPQLDKRFTPCNFYSQVK